MHLSHYKAISKHSVLEYDLRLDSLVAFLQCKEGRVPSRKLMADDLSWPAEWSLSSQTTEMDEANVTLFYPRRSEAFPLVFTTGDLLHWLPE